MSKAKTQKQVVFFRDLENTKAKTQKDTFSIIQISKGTHQDLKKYCEENGMKLQYMASFIIKEFLKNK